MTVEQIEEQGTKCKGFWNMCACEKCMLADRALELQIPAEKQKALNECAAHHGVTIDSQLKDATK